MNRERLYELSSRKVLKGRLDPNLCLYNPREVYEALKSNWKVISWLDNIAHKYTPPVGKQVLLIYPCSALKPYHMSRSYRALYRTLNSLGNRMRSLIHVVTISEPFGIVPEEYYNKWTEWYDCPGLFEWWCRRFGQPYDREYVNECIKILAQYVSQFLKRTADSYKIRIAFIRTYSSRLKVNSNHTHRRIIELASKKSGIDIRLLPPKEIIRYIVETRGSRAWDYYGVAHPIAQEYLRNYILKRVEGALKQSRPSKDL